MKKRDMMALAGSAFTVLFSGVVSAGTNPAQGTEGWKYGGYNCGCLANIKATLLSCNVCCEQAGQNDAIKPEEVYNCKAFCLQASFPCMSQP